MDDDLDEEEGASTKRSMQPSGPCKRDEPWTAMKSFVGYYFGRETSCSLEVTMSAGAPDDVVLLPDDRLDGDDRRRLLDSIRQSLEDGRAGRVSDFDEFLEELELQPGG